MMLKLRCLPKSRKGELILEVIDRDSLPTRSKARQITKSSRLFMVAIRKDDGRTTMPVFRTLIDDAINDFNKRLDFYWELSMKNYPQVATRN